MKVAQYINIQASQHLGKSFQKEIWESHWAGNSIIDLTNQLYKNPTYWRLKKLIKKNHKILEAGCGLGQWVYCLSSQGYNICGVDIARETLKKIKKAYPKMNLNVADVEKLPYRNDNFDVYLSFGVIEHFKEGPSKVLQEAYRVLKSGGLLYLTVPYLNFPRLIKYGLLTKQNGEFYQYLYSKNEILSHIKKAGFDISKVGHYDFINAVKRDLPFFYKAILVISNFRRTENHNTLRDNSGSAKKKKFSHREPDFKFQRLLYLIDSYIILVEAKKK